LKHVSSILRGGAGLALPLLLVWALARPTLALEASSPMMGMIEQAPADMPPNLNVTAMYLMGRPESLDDVPKSLGFPTTGAQMALYGGGASFGKGALRVGL
jgi:hypothetical protein